MQWESQIEKKKQSWKLLTQQLHNKLLQLSNEYTKPKSLCVHTVNID